MDGYRCRQATSTPAVAGSMNVAAGGVVQDDGLHIKEESADTDLDIGPTVLQHMDMHYRPNQKDLSVVKHERTINDDTIDPILCGGVKEEIIEDEWRGSLTPQGSLMEQPVACTALHSLHKERLGTICRVHLRRLETFQCKVCDAVYIDARKLLQHVQEVHGSDTQRSSHLHVKSPQISNGSQQCAMVPSAVVYTCDYCHKTYAHRQTLIYHIEVVHTAVLHKCSECKKEYKGRRQLRRHIRMVHKFSSLVVYTCDYCHKTYKSKQNLIFHIEVVHTKVLHRCSECKKEYKGKRPLQRHVRRVHSKKKHEFSSPVVHRCDYCHNTYAHKQTLLNHIELVHTKVLHRRSECEKVFEGKESLQVHIRKKRSKKEHECSEPRIYICDYCKKMFSYKMAILKHIALVHTGVSYKCLQCSEIFKCKEYLTLHTAKVHTAASHSQMYGCGQCVKICSSKKSLAYHCSHVHRKESHKCFKCNKEFKCSAYLRSHVRNVHSDPYECAVCKKMFKNIKSSKKHFATRHAHKPVGSEPCIYICDCCLKSFDSKAAMQNHITQVHASGSYKCHRCSKIFKCKTYLTRHIINMHNAGLPARCGKCNKNFKNSLKLQRHETRVHTPHKCEVCLGLYTTRYSLRRHVRRAHNSKDTQLELDMHRYETPDSRPTADVMNAAPSTSTQQHNVEVVKEEPADGELDLGPTVFQHMDCNYRPYEEERQDDLWGLM